MMTPRRKELEKELEVLRGIEHFVFIEVYQRGYYYEWEIEEVRDFHGKYDRWLYVNEICELDGKSTRNMQCRELYDKQITYTDALYILYGPYVPHTYLIDKLDKN